MGGGSACSLSRLEVPLAAAFAANLLFCASFLLGSGGLFPLQTPCLVDVGLEELCESGGCVHLQNCRMGCRTAARLLEGVLGM